MARYVVSGTSGVTLDGLFFPYGAVVNAPSNLATVVAGAGSITVVPRIRRVDITLNPPYVPVPVADQIGRQTSTGLLPNQDTIVEPVLPTANSQYD